MAEAVDGKPLPPSLRRAPQMRVGPRDLQRGALEAALVDVGRQARPLGVLRGTPRIVRFYPSPEGLVCAALTRDGTIGFGCARPDFADAGVFHPTPAWRGRVLRELAEAAGIPAVSEDELDPVTGLPRAR